MEWEKLIEQAFEARKTAYAPYSEFAVGAALLTGSGNIYCGCNIENAAYSPTNCAERTAIFKAVSEGERDFFAIAVCGGYTDKGQKHEKGKEQGLIKQQEQDKYKEELQYCFPCGVCLQVMFEFCNPDDFIVLVAKNPEEYKEYRLKDLLPFGFGPDNLNYDSYTE